MITEKKMKRYMRQCVDCNRRVRFKADPQDMTNFKCGIHIQVALPYVENGVKQILISGLCEKCFEKIYGKVLIR